MKALFSKPKTTSASECDIFLLFDAANLAYRCAHAYGQLSTSKGKPSGVIYGAFVQVLAMLKHTTNKAAHMVFAFEGFPQWRYDTHPEYKAGRSKTLGYDPIQDVHELASSMPCSTISNSAMEADDVIATYVVSTKKPALIVSSDKDLWQLIDNRVRVYSPSKKKIIEGTDVLEDLGVAPERVPLYKALYGDSSDNISGVPRLTKKKVNPVIASSESVSDFYQKISELTPKMQAKLNEHRSLVEANYKITQLRSDCGFHAVEREQDADKLSQLLTKYECTSLIPRISELR